jgi:predicted  nucleic acid-binding Zn-ribbon protein
MPLTRGLTQAEQTKRIQELIVDLENERTRNILLESKLHIEEHRAKDMEHAIHKLDKEIKTLQDRITAMNAVAKRVFTDLRATQSVEVKPTY